MSRRKKSYGKVKPSWYGRTKTSMCTVIENRLNLTAGTFQKRRTDNSKRRRHWGVARNRSEQVRRQNQELAEQYPVNAFVEFKPQYYRYTDNNVEERFGYIIRIRDCRYYVRLHASMRVVSMNDYEIKHRMIGANGR